MTLYGEGSYASSTNQESNLSQSSNGAENSFLRRGGIFRRSEGSGMLIGDPLSGGSSASSTNRRPITELWGADSNASSTIRRANYHRALRSGKLIPQNEKALRRSERSGKPNHELWRAGNSFLRMRGNSLLSRERHAHR